MICVESHIPANGSKSKLPVIGVMGGSFNPIHLGHVLLAVTVRETKPVDEVVVVPVFKHPVKTDLLPFEDRLAMCEMALRGKGITVSTVERETGESNVVMLQALRKKYAGGCQLFWVCGDDVFEWIDNAKGQAMMQELDGLIVQRRLHKDGSDSFRKSPLDSNKLAALGERHNLKIDVIFGELPHFSSTLVRTSPAGWKAYLPSLVGAYLEARPCLLALALESAGGLAESEQPQTKRRRTEVDPEAETACAMRCIEIVHGLQRERGCTAVALSIGSDEARIRLTEARAHLDALLLDLPRVPKDSGPALSLAEELAYTPRWLANDRRQYDEHMERALSKSYGEDHASAWHKRVALLRRFYGRIDVLIEASRQLLQTRVIPRDTQAMLSGAGSDDQESESECLFRLFSLWARGKEALGRERAFLAAGGTHTRDVLRSSLRMRSRLIEVIEHKEMMLKRILSMEQSCPAPKYQSVEALHTMLTRITALEWSLLGCFASSTPQQVQLKIVSSRSSSLAGGAGSVDVGFNVEDWYDTTSSAIDLMLTLVQALAAGICMGCCPGIHPDAHPSASCEP